MLLNRNVCGRQNPAGGVRDADCAHVAEAPCLVGRHAEGVAGVAVAVRAHGDVILVAVRVMQNVGQRCVRLPRQDSIAWRAMELGHGLHDDMGRAQAGRRPSCGRSCRWGPC